MIAPGRTFPKIYFDFGMDKYFSEKKKSGAEKTRKTRVCMSVCVCVCLFVCLSVLLGAKKSVQICQNENVFMKREHKTRVRKSFFRSMKGKHEHPRSSKLLRRGFCLCGKLGRNRRKRGFLAVLACWRQWVVLFAFESAGLTRNGFLSKENTKMRRGCPGYAVLGRGGCGNRGVNKVWVVAIYGCFGGWFF